MLVWQAHKGKILSLAFSPDGRTLATATGTGKLVSLWNATTGELIRQLKTNADRATFSVAFAPEAPLFAAGAGGRVCVWNTDTWTQIATLGSRDSYYELAFSRGPAPRLAASESYRMFIWEDAGRPHDKPTRDADRAFIVHHVACLDFSPSGETIAVNLQDHAAIYEASTTHRIQEFAHPHSHQHGPIKFSPDGNRIAIGYLRVVSVRSVAGHTAPPVECKGHKKAVWAASWSTDGRTLYTGSADGTARQWNPDTGEELKAFEWGIGEIRSTAFSSDGLLGAAASKDGKVIVWDLDT
jgi:WD40 repeat protein